MFQFETPAFIFRVHILKRF